MVGWIQNSQRFGYDKVSANTASSFSQCYEKSDGSQDPLRGIFFLYWDIYLQVIVLIVKSITEYTDYSGSPSTSGGAKVG